MGCQFIPRFIFENIANNGNAEQKQSACLALKAFNSFLAYKPELILLEHLKGLMTPFEAEEETANREIYDAQNKTALPGKLIRKEGEKSNGDKAADEAWDGAGKTFDFFQDVFSRNSIDDKGMKLLNVVHYGRNYANAFWNSKMMVFGDGDKVIFNKFTLLDIIAHEISHGITERTAGLEYWSQPGALNESFSDVFGSMVLQHSLGQTVDKASWLIGEGIFNKKINGKAIRSMSAPGTAFNDPAIGKDRQTNHMDNYDHSDYDNQCVHINSGIINRAFYTAAMALGGNSWKTVGPIWYKTLLQLKVQSNFQDCANMTVKVSNDLYGKDSRETKAVIDGWKTVGLKAKV